MSGYLGKNIQSLPTGRCYTVFRIKEKMSGSDDSERNKDDKLCQIMYDKSILIQRKIQS